MRSGCIETSFILFPKLKSSTFVLAEFLSKKCPVDPVFTMCRRTEQTSSSSIQAS